MTNPGDFLNILSTFNGVGTGPNANGSKIDINGLLDSARGQSSTTGHTADNSSLHVDPLTPPALKTLVYSPEVRIVIARDASGGP